jgi:hypothetical protein
MVMPEEELCPFPLSDWARPAMGGIARKTQRAAKTPLTAKEGEKLRKNRNGIVGPCLQV